MKSRRRFSFSRAVRVRLANFTPRRWWSSADSQNDKLPGSAPATIADDFNRSTHYERLDKSENWSRSLSFVREEPSMPRTEAVNAARLYKIATLKLLFNSPLSLFSKLKASYGSVREAAKVSGLNVSDLFVGNQLLMHVSATPVSGRKKIEAKPSKGFMEPGRALQIAATAVNTNTERER